MMRTCKEQRAEWWNERVAEGPKSRRAQGPREVGLAVSVGSVQRTAYSVPLSHNRESASASASFTG
jgi:hypothetical protein